MVKAKDEILFSVVHRLYFFDETVDLTIESMNELYWDILDYSDNKNQNNIMFVMDNNNGLLNYDKLFYFTSRLIMEGVNLSIVLNTVSTSVIVDTIRLKPRTIFLHLTGQEFAKWIKYYTKSNDYTLSDTDLVYINLVDEDGNTDLLDFIINSKKKVESAFILDQEYIPDDYISHLSGGFIINQGESLALKIQT